MMRQIFSMSERSGLQAGHFSTRILLLHSHDVVIDTVCGLALSCWKMQGLPWKIFRLQTLCNFSLRNSFLILLHYFSPQHWGHWWSSSHLDFWETLPLWEALFIPNHVANWPNKLQIGPRAVPYMYIYLFQPLIATCPNFFGMCSSHEIQNEPIFGMTFQNVSLSTFDSILSIFYCE